MYHHLLCASCAYHPHGRRPTTQPRRRRHSRRRVRRRRVHQSGVRDRHANFAEAVEACTVRTRVSNSAHAWCQLGRRGCALERDPFVNVQVTKRRRVDACCMRIYLWRRLVRADRLHWCVIRGLRATWRYSPASRRPSTAYFERNTQLLLAVMVYAGKVLFCLGHSGS